MHNRLIPILGTIAGGLFALYVVLVCSTVIFAGIQTNLARSMQEIKGSIASLETSYYSKITEFSTLDPKSIGFITPKNVEYISAISSSGLTFAGK
jgi:hypothetical protein